MAEHDIALERSKPRQRQFPRFIKYSLFTLLLVIIGLVGIEVILRAIFGPPQGYFNFLRTSEIGLYPPNRRLVIRFGHIPYEVVANRYGMRGPDFPLEKPPGTIRIACIGDSVTDGFFVENQYTYPYQLEKTLHSRGYPNVHVVSIARGGCTIDVELARLKELALPLKPDLVILTFVTNDIGELRGKSREQLFNTKICPPFSNAIADFLLTRTTVGERLMLLYLAAFTYHSKESKDRQTFTSETTTASRQWSPAEIRRFSREFLKRFADTDGLVHTETFTSETEQLFATYLEVFQEFARLCAANGSKLLLIYFPSIVQIHDLDSPRTIVKRLQDACRAYGVDFYDLTECMMNTLGNNAYLFAPIDYHPTPYGYRVVAECVADYVIKQYLVTNVSHSSHLSSGGGNPNPLGHAGTE